MIKAYLQDNLKSLIFFTLITVATIAGLSTWCHRIGEPWLKSILAVTAVSPYLFFYFALLFNKPMQPLQAYLKQRPFHIFYLGIGLMLPYLLYCLASQSFHWFGPLKLILLMLGPLFFTGIAAKNHYGKWTWYDLALVVWIWIPFDLRLLNHIWLWPPGDAEYSLNTLFALTLVAPLYIYLRGIPKVGLPLRWQDSDLKTVLTYTNAYTVIAVPLGLITAFLAWNPQTNLGSWFSQPLGIFFFIAVPEELLFRGLFLSYLEDKIKTPHVPLILSSVLFGLSHLNNPPLWDWRYLMMSSLAGIVYGLAFMRSRNLLAPIIIHTIVDYVWVQFLLTEELMNYAA